MVNGGIPKFLHPCCDDAIEKANKCILIIESAHSTGLKRFSLSVCLINKLPLFLPTSEKLIYPSAKALVVALNKEKALICSIYCVFHHSVEVKIEEGH